MTLRTLSVLLLAGGSICGLQANNLVCSMSSSASGPFSNTPCAQSFTAGDFLNWGAPSNSGGLGEAIDPGATNLSPTMDTVWVTSSLGVQMTVTSNLTLERADNTTYAWDTNLGTPKWVLPTMTNFGETINTFNGHFGAPSCESTGPQCETSTPPYGPNNYPYQFGDPLLGAVGNQGVAPQLTITFSQLLEGVAFRVSTKTDSSFIATLDAYDSNGTLLGVYMINATGGGGACIGLNNALNPTPCNDAPLIQFYDPEGRIASVLLTANDTSGMFVDQLSLEASPFSPTGTPDPGTATLIGAGLIALALVGRRLSRTRQDKEDSPRA